MAEFHNKVSPTFGSDQVAEREQAQHLGNEAYNYPDKIRDVEPRSNATTSTLAYSNPVPDSGSCSFSTSGSAPASPLVAFHILSFMTSSFSLGFFHGFLNSLQGRGYRYSLKHKNGQPRQRRTNSRASGSERLLTVPSSMSAARLSLPMGIRTTSQGSSGHGPGGTSSRPHPLEAAAAAAAVIQQSPRSRMMGTLKKKPTAATDKGTENPRGVGSGGDGAGSDTTGKKLVLL
ncbi:hypothetical protein GE21DRAFT_1201585 [Neurospora crassa]|uniref:Uncharacterized protein B17B1.090 n=1 Tax=Neurospora crassa TaxID=5141 RepID=Q873D3_NEUCS|nr:hypothetical protein GE21DRAFT_1201585 [Neurospora crassa]CAD70376.1 hypothetical protein [Neurospora crassa]